MIITTNVFQEKVYVNVNDMKYGDIAFGAINRTIVMRIFGGVVSLQNPSNYWTVEICMANNYKFELFPKGSSVVLTQE